MKVEKKRLRREKFAAIEQKRAKKEKYAVDRKDAEASGWTLTPRRSP